MATSDGMLSSLMIVLGLNLMIFFVAGGLTSLGGADANPFDYKDNLLGEFNTANRTAYDLNESGYGINTNASQQLPGGEGKTVSADTGLSFTDIFTSVKNWFLNIKGVAYVLAVLSGPKVLLGLMGMPLGASWALTSIWYGITLFMLVSYIWGR